MLTEPGVFLGLSNTHSPRIVHPIGRDPTTTNCATGQPFKKRRTWVWARGFPLAQTVNGHPEAWKTRVEERAYPGGLLGRGGLWNGEEEEGGFKSRSKSI